MFVVACFTFILCSLAEAKDQAIGARGQLMCGNKPLANTEVKLWELDTWPNFDDLLATVRTDRQGRFQIQGYDNEMLPITPVVKFYHDCDNVRVSTLGGLCKRKVAYELPESYIVDGRSTRKFFDFGTINMEAKPKAESSKCIGK